MIYLIVQIYYVQAFLRGSKEGLDTQKRNKGTSCLSVSTTSALEEKAVILRSKEVLGFFVGPALWRRVHGLFGSLLVFLGLPLEDLLHRTQQTFKRSSVQCRDLAVAFRDDTGGARLPSEKRQLAKVITHLNMHGNPVAST